MGILTPLAGGLRCYVMLLVSCLAWSTFAFAQEATPQQLNLLPATVTTDAEHLLELGQLLMGQNNPGYALKRAELDQTARNEAGAQAVRTLKQLTTLYPKFADGWLWLGIAYTETLRYSDKAPRGEPARTKESIASGIEAFRTAWELQPNDLVYATYFGEALMTYCADFDGARKFWEKYLATVKTDMQRVTALTQIARACLNKGYFGKINKTLSAVQIKEQYTTAEKYVNEAAAICPRAADVQAMQKLLRDYRAILYGKDK